MATVAGESDASIPGSLLTQEQQLRALLLDYRRYALDQILQKDRTIVKRRGRSDPKKGGGSDDEEQEEKAEEVKVNWRVNRWRRWSRFRKFARKRRPKVRIPSLRRFLRRKDKVVSTVRVSLSSVLRRLKEGRPYLADLFAGNYLFMQVTPSSLKNANKSYMGPGLHGFTSKNSPRKIA
ncbi:hypothetical protein NE237_007597 [Protea cynaroides]|uniref:Uncharacterized protein n=1 Tax=Protea cynaroides TaxID=273540 RepID=A0A9Q0KPJ9_9MAGN|nr:hypothetical protein NE237_007597 [Protea cynaroides]